MSRSLSEREREKLAGEIATLHSHDIEQLKARWRTLRARHLHVLAATC